jgi:hypothetical protein
VVNADIFPDVKASIKPNGATLQYAIPGAPAQNPDPRTTDDKFLIEFVSEDVDTIKQMLIDTGVEEITVKDA